MAKYYYNGVLLPEIPNSYLSERSYCMIAKGKGTYDGYYFVSYSKYPFVQYNTYVHAINVTGSMIDYDQKMIQGRYGGSSLGFTDWTVDETTVFMDYGADLSVADVIWSNYDILSYDMITGKTTGIYLETTEAIPFTEKMYLFTESEVKGIADSIRRKTGKSNPIVKEDFPSEIDGISSGGGIENGYDVMFYDENNEELALHSVKQGHSTNAPNYTCKSWKTEDGVSVSFPYTPTEDIIFIANNDTYASQLYEFFGVDSVLYPYLCISFASDCLIYVCFGKTTLVSYNTLYLKEALMVYIVADEKFTDYENVGDFVAYVMYWCNAKGKTLSSYGEVSSHQSRYQYTNFESDSICAGEYRLDE